MSQAIAEEAAARAPAGTGGRAPRASVACRPSLRATRSLWLRGLGACFFAAFVSFAVQVEGLIGSHGILPAQEFLDRVAAYYGDEAHWLLPSVFWLSGAGDLALKGVCAGGAAAAGLLFAGFAAAPALALCVVLYGSLCAVGQTFLGFQWDALLCEAGVVGFAVAPWRPLRLAAAPEPARLGIWLARLLLFKLMFLSGVAKLASGDPAWRDGSALAVHYMTTCLPTWVGWLAHQLPDPVQRLSTWSALAIELALPFAIFVGRRGRLLAFAGFALLQVAIAATGNYGFFNLLTLCLCVSLLDDVWLDRAARFARAGRAWPAAAWRRRAPRPSARALAGFAALLLLPASAAQVASATLGPRVVPGALREWALWAAQLRIANSYGLFATMTKRRPEISVEGSEDGRSWHPYVFRYKPGDPARRPSFVLLHMPRLDWQMWFAALSSPRAQPWFGAFVERLAEASPPVLALLAHDPFGGAPPRFVRARLDDYRFSTLAQWRATGRWWVTRPIGPYYGPVARPSQATDTAPH